MHAFGMLYARIGSVAGAHAHYFVKQETIFSKRRGQRTHMYMHARSSNGTGFTTLGQTDEGSLLKEGSSIGR